jgi:hypothetical protein
VQGEREEAVPISGDVSLKGTAMGASEVYSVKRTKLNRTRFVFVQPALVFKYSNIQIFKVNIRPGRAISNTTYLGKSESPTAVFELHRPTRAKHDSIALRRFQLIFSTFDPQAEQCSRKISALFDSKECTRLPRQ